MTQLTPNGEKIRELRLASPDFRKQEALSRQTGISIRTLRDLEKNRTTLAKHRMITLAGALGVDYTAISMAADGTRSQIAQSSAVSNAHSVMATGGSAARSNVVSLVRDPDPQGPYYPPPGDIYPVSPEMLPLRLMPCATVRELRKHFNWNKIVEYQIEVDPLPENVELIDDVLTYLRALMADHRGAERPCDEFDERDNHALYREAHVNHLIRKLHAQDIGLFAGQYTAFQDEHDDANLPPTFRPRVKHVFVLHFAPADEFAVDTSYNVGMYWDTSEGRFRCEIPF